MACGGWNNGGCDLPQNFDDHYSDSGIGSDRASIYSGSDATIHSSVHSFGHNDGDNVSYAGSLSTISGQSTIHESGSSVYAQSICSGHSYASISLDSQSISSSRTYASLGATEASGMNINPSGAPQASGMTLHLSSQTNQNSQQTTTVSGSTSSGSTISFTMSYAQRMAMIEADRPIRRDRQYDEVPPNCRPENMFPPYVSIFSNAPTEEPRRKNQETMEVDDSTEDDRNKPSEAPTLVLKTYERCCLRHDRLLGGCGPTSHRERIEWSDDCVTFAHLKNRPVSQYLKRLGLIKKSSEDTLVLNERNLIANRLRLRNIDVDDTMSICPRHRSSFGIDWSSPSSSCQHPDHDQQQPTRESNCRRPSLDLSTKINNFPIGGRLCTKHRRQEKPPKALPPITEVSRDSNETLNQSTDQSTNQSMNVSMYEINDTREAMNRVLAAANMPLIRSQTTTSLNRQADSSVRRLVSQLRRGVETFEDKYAEALAPGQGAELIRRARAEPPVLHLRTPTSEAEIVQNIQRVYQFYVERKVPFIEQARLLSLLPRSWTYEKIMDTFACSRHMIKISRQMQANNELMLNLHKEPAIRQRVDANKVRHFVTWLVESDTLVSGTYGLTTLNMDSGDLVEISKQILQCQKSHAISSYRKYCEETGFECLGNRKLFDILDGLKPAQQRALAGLDEFVVEGIEAWETLSNIVSKMPLPQTIRKRIIQQIQMAEQYQKTAHSGHCSSNADCIMHCTTFALSDPKCTAYQTKCTREHGTMCTDCVNIIVTLDEIHEKISKIVDDEMKREIMYDFQHASEQIIEWSRHNVRATCQYEAKNLILSEMTDNDEVFCTFDWGQKVLPQEFRESQSSYFGKKGMSVLVGSFVWKRPGVVIRSANNSDTPGFKTQTYILTLTNASQTDLDTLSGFEIILKQFQKEHPNLKKLHKRSDNASNFSSHSTPEAERLICDRLGIELKTRDYSEVQKGKDICDRVCGAAKSRMRSWVSAGNDLLNANDIKEGMEYVGGVRNTKVAVAEIVDGQGILGKTNVPNVSTIRSIIYHSDEMRIFKASNIGRGMPIPYRKIDFESNMRVVSSFSDHIDDAQAVVVPKKRTDRENHDIIMCTLPGCTSTFESESALDAHIAANLHEIPPSKPQTTKDVARNHLVETLRTTNVQVQEDRRLMRTTHATSNVDLSNSIHYQQFSSVGWALRTRRHHNPVRENVRTFIEEMFSESQRTHSKLTVERVRDEIRTRRNADTGEKLFKPDEYPTLNQIRYQIKKVAAKNDISTKDELIHQLIVDNIEKN